MCPLVCAPCLPSQFEQAATEVLKEHYANTEEGSAQDVQPVQIMLNSSSPLVQSRSRSIRDLAVRICAAMHNFGFCLHPCRFCLHPCLPSLQAERVSQLVMITGIITAAAKPKVSQTRRQS